MKRTVLVVEDDFDTLQPLAELLRLRGYNVIAASDAERGLKIARESGPDLIITDIVLPGKSGLQFIANVRSSRSLKSTPIIVISGCGPMVLVEAEATGANVCIEKPISIDLFWRAIDQVFGAAQANEGEEPAEPREDRGRVLAGEIDDLVETLRHCTNKVEKEDTLTQLKARIHEIQTRRTTVA
ncbi:MAG: response regulator [Acidobacteriota bacterium]